MLIGLNLQIELIALNFRKSYEESNFSVLTWNVHCEDGACAERQVEIANLIVNTGADFVLLNEYNQDNCGIIDSILRKTYLYTEEIHSHQNCGDIFYSKKRLHNSGNLYFPEKGRYVHTIEATVVVDEDSVHIYGVHLASNNKTDGAESTFIQHYERYLNAQKERIFETGWIKTVISKSSTKSIVLGDFNDLSYSAPCDSLKDIGLLDAWWEGGFGYGTTFHDGFMRLRIDHIFYSPEMKLCSVEIIETDLSDHNPIVARFNIDRL